MWARPSTSAKRVKSHFSNNKTNRQKQDFLRETAKISYKQCATELMAHILESTEIRRLWPIHNRSQRGYLPQFGLFSYEDRNGYIRLAIEKNRQATKPLYTFNTVVEGQMRLRELISEFGLCNRLCNISPDCMCESHVSAAEYNALVEEAMGWMRKHLPTFAYIDKGIEDNEHSCILIMEGNFVGMGYLTDKKQQMETLDILKSHLEPLQDNDFIRNLVYKHANENPEKCVEFN